MAAKTRFVSQFPSVPLRDDNGKAIKELLWGDGVSVIEEEGDVVRVSSRGRRGLLPRDAITEDRLLEVNFIDIGQGDGCFIVTPDDQKIVVDAGEGDNMHRFLSWRFNLRRRRAQNPEIRQHLDHVVITHSDADHYKGFRDIVRNPAFTIGTIYHNGIVERATGKLLGPETTVDGEVFLSETIRDRDTLETLLSDDDVVGRKLYPGLLRDTLTNGRCEDIRMLCSEDGFLPGFTDADSVTIRVLAPVPEGGNKRLLRRFGDDGKTKNGHSIVLKLAYRGVRILLGGDLNIPAEFYLLAHYTGKTVPPKTTKARERLIQAARDTFECDIAKACHHGSADFSDLFLQAVNACATVISSGDAEPHSHPRPDSLGAIGRNSFGDRPLIFSTELARSGRENFNHPNQFRAELKQLIATRNETEDEEKRERLNAKIDKLLEQIERSVAVYGMISVRTDGERAIVAQKLEEKRGQKEFDIYELTPVDGRLTFKSKHAD
jgi:beta-lactamase superfamily II metal-dependent hydrolase